LQRSQIIANCGRSKLHNGVFSFFASWSAQKIGPLPSLDAALIVAVLWLY